MYDIPVTSIYELVLEPFALAHPDIPLVLENQPFDWANTPDRFVSLEVTFYNGEQIGMAESPKTRLTGCVYATTYFRKGKGTLDALRVLGTLATLLQYKSAGAVRLQAATLEDAAETRDWHCNDLKVPFHADMV